MEHRLRETLRENEILLRECYKWLAPHTASPERRQVRSVCCCHREFVRDAPRCQENVTTQVNSACASSAPTTMKRAAKIEHLVCREWPILGASEWVSNCDLQSFRGF